MEFDIFLSYRRSDGDDKAGRIKATLESEGYAVFLDHDNIKDGNWKERLFNVIKDSSVFMMLITPDYISERLYTPQDNVRWEIESAIAQKKKLVPVIFDNDVFERDLPDIIANTMEQISRVHRDYYDECIQTIIQNRIEPYSIPHKERFINAIVNSIISDINHERYDEAYEKSLKYIDIRPDDARLPLLAAIASLQGKRPYFQLREDINRAVKYLKEALLTEKTDFRKGAILQLLAYIKEDYFEKKRFRTDLPSSHELMTAAINLGFTGDISREFYLLAK